MECLIFSDSHGKAGLMERVLRRQPTAPSVIFFLGDGLRDSGFPQFERQTLYAVKGNCDGGWFGSLLPYDEECVVSLEGHRILAVHGHRYGVKSGVGALLSHAAAIEADVVLFGHTHVPLDEVIPAGTAVGSHVLTRPLHLFNPGSLAEGSFGTLLMQGDVVLFSHGNI